MNLHGKDNESDICSVCGERPVFDKGMCLECASRAEEQAYAEYEDRLHEPPLVEYEGPCEYCGNEDFEFVDEHNETQWVKCTNCQNVYCIVDGKVVEE